MTIEPPPEPASQPQPARQIVTSEDFAVVAVEAPLDGMVEVDAWPMSTKFLEATRSAEAEGRDEAARVYGLLNALCQIHLRPEDRADPWGAHKTGAQWRTALPSDFKGAQTEVLADQLDTIVHPALRARLADIVWTNDRKSGAAGKLAYVAYCETLEGLLSGRFHAAHDTKKAGATIGERPMCGVSCNRDPFSGVMCVE